MLFPDALLNSPLFGIGLTVILYAMSEIIVDRFNLNVLPPFVIACPLVICVIAFVPGVEYKQYQAGAEFINFLLGPATIALALPLYKNRQIIMEKAAAIASGVTIATLAAILVVYFCGKALAYRYRRFQNARRHPCSDDGSRNLYGYDWRNVQP